MAQMNQEQDLALMLQETIRVKIAAIAEEEVEACKARISERINAEVDSIALNLFKSYNVTMGGDVLHISVTKREVEKTLGR